MGLWQKIKPAFWDRRESQLELLNYRRLWRNTFVLGLVAHPACPWSSWPG